MPDAPNSGSNRKSQVAGLGNQVRSLMPTPTAIQSRNATSGRQEGSTHHAGTTLYDLVFDGSLLGTPRVSTNHGSTSKERNNGAKKARLEDQVEGAQQGLIDWGRFAPAIERWETVLGRPAPEPTVPDGKNGQHRLSARFTEWLMGLPDGWVTDAGLTRNEQLKACGNGVVPQQAALALRRLLND